MARKRVTFFSAIQIFFLKSVGKIKKQSTQLFIILFVTVWVSLIAINVQAQSTFNGEALQSAMAKDSDHKSLLLASELPAEMLSPYSKENASESEKLARESYALGNFEEAVKYWQQAISAYEMKRDWLNQAIALSNLSLTYQQLGRWEDANSAIKNSINLLPKESDTNLSAELKAIAQIRDIQGDLQWEQGQVNTALKTWQESANIHVKLKDELGWKRNLIAQVKAMQELGFYEQACQVLIPVMGLENQGNFTIPKQSCQQLTDNSNKVKENEVKESKAKEPLLSEQLEKLKSVSYNLNTLQLTGVRLMGDVLRKLGYLDKSLNLLEEVKTLIDRQQLPEEKALVWLSLGNTYESLGNRNEFLSDADASESGVNGKKDYYLDALNSYQEAVKIAEIPQIKIQAQLNLFSLLSDSKVKNNVNFKKEAEDLYLAIVSQLNNLPPSRQKVYAEISLMKSLSSQLKNKELKDIPNESWQEIIELGEQAVKLAKDLDDDRATAYAVGNLGKIYVQKEQWLEAQKLTEKALLLSQNVKQNWPDLTYQWQRQLGQILRDREEKDIDSAIAAYTAAFNTLQSVRNDLVPISRDGQFDFRDQIEPVYRDLVDLLLQEEKPEQKQKNLKQARKVIEALQVAELDNFFREACIQIKTKEIDSIDRTAAVIYPIILEDRLEVIVSLPDKLLHYQPSDTPRETVEELVKKLQEELRVVGERAEVPKISKIFYRWLIKPFEKDLREYPDIKTLVFVLDGSLRNIPMGVLSDYDETTKKGTYLIEKYAIALAPGLQLISPKSWQPEKLKVLMAGVSEQRNFPGRMIFAPLQYVEQELGSIKKEFPNSEKPLINQDFLKNTLRDKINSFSSSVVHIATHGEFSSDPEQTFIVAYDDVIQSKELSDILSIRPENKGNSIELLVLSACKTAKGDPRAALGLAGVAVRSGARSTLATLWYVDDKSTTELMIQFYNEIKKPNVNKAEALRHAQLSLIAKQPDPYYWAPFVMIGNWL
ncbi:CHAT domain-containing protein [Kamptonema sp. UHCC 0994]|uniref:CHAT domain-containing protein n=1 Tax=Kamptonema sp. UHCC 0994 TaxID=3031329 RepID=UPI0023BA303E|nr:CHAT domain-containing protein [Kamptonema sp. UHCC 0994]MDF0553636.1 CHAT domain-containing protein [Kamptonema sp. UHCC 0994]